MRKCYLDNLPKKKYGDKNIINWASSVDCIVNFEYDNIEGCFQILEVDIKNEKLKVLYNGCEFLIAISSVRECKLFKMINGGSYDYIYKNGQTVKNNGLGLIAGRFKDKNHIKHYYVKCVDCGYKYIRSQTSVRDRGVRCPVCSDGISYPTKIMSNILSQLNISFKREKTFDWSKNKKYDFYVESMGVIIEVHGGQHYKDGFGGLKRGRSLKEEQDNDRLKKDIALINGINHYIVIDARESNLEWIKENVLRSKLNELYDLSNIDWSKCEESASNNLTREICSMYVEGDISISRKIAKELGVSFKTVIEHLKRGASIGWCNYDPKKMLSLAGSIVDNNRKKAVVCIDNGLEFESASYCAKVSKDVF